MTFNDSERGSINKVMDRLLSRYQSSDSKESSEKITFKICDRDVLIFLLKPTFYDFHIEFQTLPIAKATFYPQTNSWALFWMRSNYGWQLYQDDSLGSFSACVRVLEKDECNCFFK